MAADNGNRQYGTKAIVVGERVLFGAKQALDGFATAHRLHRRLS